MVDGQAYEYQALCFGISSAPRLFTKVLQPVVTSLRLEGVTCSFYLDDGLVVGSSREECAHGVRLLLQRLRDCGFAVNRAKC